MLSDLVAPLRYFYTVDTLTLNDAYDLARLSGKTYADYLVDFS